MQRAVAEIKGTVRSAGVKTNGVQTSENYQQYKVQRGMLTVHTAGGNINIGFTIPRC